MEARRDYVIDLRLCRKAGIFVFLPQSMLSVGSEGRLPGLTPVTFMRPSASLGCGIKLQFLAQNSRMGRLSRLVNYLGDLGSFIWNTCQAHPGAYWVKISLLGVERSLFWKIPLRRYDVHPSSKWGGFLLAPGIGRDLLTELALILVLLKGLVRSQIIGSFNLRPREPYFPCEGNMWMNLGE